MFPYMALGRCARNDSGEKCSRRRCHLLLLHLDIRTTTKDDVAFPITAPQCISGRSPPGFARVGERIAMVSRVQDLGKCAVNVRCFVLRLVSSITGQYGAGLRRLFGIMVTRFRRCAAKVQVVDPKEPRGGQQGSTPAQDRAPTPSSSVR